MLALFLTSLLFCLFMLCTRNWKRLHFNHATPCDGRKPKHRLRWHVGACSWCEVSIGRPGRDQWVRAPVQAEQTLGCNQPTLSGCIGDAACKWGCRDSFNIFGGLEWECLRSGQECERRTEAENGGLIGE